MLKSSENKEKRQEDPINQIKKSTIKKGKEEDCKERKH